MTDTADLTVYVFVRTDLPVADQIVQVGHVSIVAAREHDIPAHCRMVLIGVSTTKELQGVIETCRISGIRTSTFHECDPVSDEVDEPMGLTAACTEPLERSRRRRLRRYPLWAP